MASGEHLHNMESSYLLLGGPLTAAIAAGAGAYAPAVGTSNQRNTAVLKANTIVEVKRQILELFESGGGERANLQITNADTGAILHAFAADGVGPTSEQSDSAPLGIIGPYAADVTLAMAVTLANPNPVTVRGMFLLKKVIRRASRRTTLHT